LPLSRPSLLISSFAALIVFGCADDERKPRVQAPVVPQPTSEGPLECRFDPVTLANEPSKSGLDMCYTPNEPAEWWSRYRAPVRAAPPAKPDAAGDAEPDAEPPEQSACPSEMVLIEGMYCPDVRQRCLHYLDENHTFLSHNRCKEYDRHPECAAEREARRFCIDLDEYVAPEAELPLAEQSWTTAKELCESQSKRLCFESEWQFACEGEDLLPYPYGFERNSKICNFDITNLENKRTGKLLDKRVRPSDRPACTSPFGIRNMVGNMDEWTYRDSFVKPYRAALHGGWWLAGRNNCRAATTGHDEFYFGLQTGVRCCKNAR
jgi:Sulfatase-modifying factor enzyme 1